MTAEGATSRLWYAATTVDVTPRVPVALGGYLARHGQPATGTHDRLTASLLLLSDESGQRAVCWVTVDALSLDVDTCARIRREVADGAEISPDAVLVCCSHTHSAAASWSRMNFWPNQDTDDTQLDRLVKDISKAAPRLPKTRCPVTAGWAIVADGGIGTNRYDPKGPHDRSTGVLTLREANDTIVAILFDYACHPTVLGHANLEYSADFPSATRSVAAAALLASQGVETPPVLAFLQGAAGDVSTRFTRRAQDFAEMQRQGGILASAVLRGALEAEPAHVRPDAIPMVHRATVAVPTRVLPSKAVAAQQLAAAERAWHAERERGANTPRARIARTRREGAMVQSEQVATGLPAHYDLPISVVSLGELAWVHLPVEPFTCYANTIRGASPFAHTRIVGYTDGYFGYLADSAAHDAGIYEASSSTFDPNGASVLVNAVHDLLHKAWRAR